MVGLISEVATSSLGLDFRELLSVLRDVLSTSTPVFALPPSADPCGHDFDPGDDCCAFRGDLSKGISPFNKRLESEFERDSRIALVEEKLRIAVLCHCFEDVRIADEGTST
jgi:hypothetical protein